MDISTREFLQKHFPPRKQYNMVGFSRGWFVDETLDDYVARVNYLIGSFNRSLDTPEDQPWINVMILSLQKIHVYPTQRITVPILNEFHQWYKENVREMYKECPEPD